MKYLLSRIVFVTLIIFFTNFPKSAKSIDLRKFSVPSSADFLLDDDYSMWANFKKKYNRNYASRTEELHRMGIFLENLSNVRKFNRAGFPSTQAVNHFSDLTTEEIRSRFTKYEPEKNNKNQNKYEYGNGNDDDGDGGFFMFETKLGNRGISEKKKTKEPGPVLPPIKLPRTVDWAAKGAVTSVEDQGLCNSCWSFATTATLEAQLYKKTGELTKLSKQMLVDCFGGCDYNNVPNTYYFVMQKGGIMAEKCYGRYVPKRSTCKFKPNKVVGTVENFHKIQKGNETAMSHVLHAIGPITAWIKITKSLLLHSKGVYSQTECNDAKNVLGTHIFAIVGYGEEDGLDFFLVKNSWGPDWGEKGLGKILRNSNLCGIADFNYYPIAAPMIPITQSTIFSDDDTESGEK